MIQRLLAVVAVGGLVLSLYAFSRTAQPDPQLIRLAVRATVFAQSTPMPQVVEVTRIVEVTRVVERLVEVTTSPTLTPTATSTATPLAEVAPPSLANEVQAAAFVAAIPLAEAEPTAAVLAGCPVVSDRQYGSIPVAGGGLEHPDSIHGDLNLAMRGYTPVEAEAVLVTINGPTDGDPPQLATLFGDARTPTLTQTWRVNDWDWSCGENGCQGNPLSQVEVSLLGMQTTAGELLMAPSRGEEVYAGGVKAIVLYAEENRVTLGYTREGGVANGYTIHIESLCVDPNLLSRYRTDNAAGRANLPGLHAGDVIGSAAGDQIAVAIRDRGVFADPRSRKDWWRGR